MKNNLLLCIICFVLGSFHTTPCTAEIPLQRVIDKQPFYSPNGKSKQNMLTDFLQKSPLTKRKEQVNSLWQEFLNQPHFARRRIENRLKVDRLTALLLKYEYTEYFKTVSSDLLGGNYTSLLAHFALMQYYDRLENSERASFHESVITTLVERILSSGKGTYFSPYVVSSLAEIDEYLFIGKFNVKGQHLFWTENDNPIVEVLIAHKDTDKLDIKFFYPRSVDKLEQEYHKQLSLEKKYLRYCTLAELSLQDPAAQTGLAQYLIDFHAELYKPHYIESLLKRSKEKNPLYHNMIKARYLAGQALKTRDSKQRKSLSDEATDLFMAVAEENYGEAYFSLHALLGELKEYKNNPQLLTNLLTKGHELGSRNATFFLADLYAIGNEHFQKDTSKAKELYLEAFESGVPLAAKYYALLTIANTKKTFSEGYPAEVNELLDKAIAMNSREAILLRAKGLFENKNWTRDDILLGKKLLEQLSLFDNTQHELNEMAWVYGTHASKDIKNTEIAVSLIAEAFRKFGKKKIYARLWDTAASIMAAENDVCNAIIYQRLAVNSINKKKSKTTASYIQKQLTEYEFRYAKETGKKAIPRLQCKVSMFDAHNMPLRPQTIGYGNGIYKGEIENGKAHGKGTYHWDEGDRLTGTFVKDVPTGLATFQWGKKSDWSGHLFQGIYVEGHRQGVGLYIWENGDLYFGEYKKDQQTGHGKAIYTNGSLYEGDFVNGVQHGQGYYLATDGTVYKGDTQNDKFEGNGQFFYSSGNHYKGEVSKDFLNGQGVFTWLSGSTYTGVFKNDQLHGSGICVFESEPEPCQFEKNKLVEEKKANE